MKVKKLKKTGHQKYRITKVDDIKAAKLVQAKTSKVKKYKSRIYQSCKTCLSKTESLARVAASTLAFHLPSWWQNPPTSTTLQSFNFTQIQMKIKMQVQIQIQIQNWLNKPPILMSSNQDLCFQGGPLNSSLFYRKVGHGPDGWVVGMDLEESSFIISTRLIGLCKTVTNRDKAWIVWIVWN